MNDFVIMQVLDSRGNLLGPLHEPGGRYFVFALSQEVEQGPIGAIFHDNAENRGLRAHAPKLDDVGVVELSQVVNVGVHHFLHFLHCHQLIVVLAHEHSPLGP